MALLAACAEFLSGCNSFSLDDGASFSQEQHAGAEGSLAARDRAVDTYVAAATPGNVGYRIGPQEGEAFWPAFRLGDVPGKRPRGQA